MENQISNSSDEVGQQIKLLGDLVIQAFRCLKHKHESQRATDRQAALTQAANWKETHYDRLHSSLLPLLKEQLLAITALLETLRREPESRFKRVMELLPELDFKISQVVSAVGILCPGRLFAESQTDDHELKEFKRFRLIDLKELFDQLHWAICAFLETASEHIQRMKLSTVGLVDHRPDNNENLLQAASELAFGWIDCMIKHFQGSELDVAEDRRAYAVAAIDQLLENTCSIITPDGPDTGPLIQRKLIQPPIIQLTELTIPIIKLVKLFFKKLSKEGMNNMKRLKLPRFTRMNSIQLASLSQSAGKIFDNLNELVRLLTEIDLMAADHQALAINNRLLMIQIVERLPPHFEPPLLSLALHLIPSIGHLAEQKYYQTWFITWNILIDTAIQNFLQLARIRIWP